MWEKQEYIEVKGAICVAFNDIWKISWIKPNIHNHWLAVKRSQNLLNTKKTKYRKNDMENVKSRGKRTLGRDEMGKEKQFGYRKRDHREWLVKYVIYTLQYWRLQLAIIQIFSCFLLLLVVILLKKSHSQQTTCWKWLCKGLGITKQTAISPFGFYSKVCKSHERMLTDPRVILGKMVLTVIS